jgi:adenylate cyclase, class 2
VRPAFFAELFRRGKAQVRYPTFGEVMAQEIEVKLKPQNMKAFLRALKRLGGTPLEPKTPRMHEMNLLFDTPDGGLAKHGQLLRIRTETPASEKGKQKSRGAKVSQQRTLLTFKSPTDQLAIGQIHAATDRRYKVREEIETTLADGNLVQRIFEGLGLRGWFRYEKYRTTYRLPTKKRWAEGLLIEVDETPIGTYVELEGPGKAIDQAAQELGYSPKNFILKNYLVLYLDDCKQRGQQPTHMLFPTKK